MANKMAEKSVEELGEAYGREHDIRFLVLLCRSCHGKYHANQESRLAKTLHSYMDKKGVMEKGGNGR